MSCRYCEPYDTRIIQSVLILVLSACTLYKIRLYRVPSCANFLSFHTLFRASVCYISFSRSQLIFVCTKKYVRPFKGFECLRFIFYHSFLIFLVRSSGVCVIVDIFSDWVVLESGFSRFQACLLDYVSGASCYARRSFRYDESLFNVH